MNFGSITCKNFGEYGGGQLWCPRRLRLGPRCRRRCAPWRPPHRRCPPPWRPRLGTPGQLPEEHDNADPLRPCHSHACRRPTGVPHRGSSHHLLGHPADAAAPNYCPATARRRQNRRHAPVLEGTPHEQGRSPRIRQSRPERDPHPPAPRAGSTEEDNPSTGKDPGRIPVGGARQCPGR